MGWFAPQDQKLCRIRIIWNIKVRYALKAFIEGRLHRLLCIRTEHGVSEQYINGALKHRRCASDCRISTWLPVLRTSTRYGVPLRSTDTCFVHDTSQISVARVPAMRALGHGNPGTLNYCPENTCNRTEKVPNPPIHPPQNPLQRVV